MAVTKIRSKEIGDSEVRRADLNITASGSAVIAKAVQGTGISLSSTGVDAGTGDVTIGIDSTVATLTGSQTLTNKTLSGSANTLSNIGNSSLTNSSVTIGSTGISLGATATTLAGLTSVTVTQDPSSPLELATKQYVDAVASGLTIKASVRAATTANISDLAAGAPNTLDGVSLAANDRILVKNQSTGSQNGIYKVDTLGSGANGVWSRTTDADSSAEVPNGMFVWVNEGTTNADSGWVLTNDGTITLGSTSLVFTQFTGVGQIVAGAGLTKTGPNTLDVGAGTGITVNADNVQISASYVGQTSLTTLGTITTGTWNGTVIGSQYGGTGQNFSASSGLVKFASGTASVVAAPTGTVVGTTDTQTLTNKTLDNTNTVTLSDSLFTLQDNGDSAKQARFELSGITTGNTRVFTLPDSNTTLVGTALTQTLSNKSISGTGLSFLGSTSGTINLLAAATAGTNTLTLPAITGTIITTSDTASVSNTMLANSTISGIALGSNLNTLTIGTGLSGTSYDGSTGVTIAIDSTVATLTGSQTLTNKTLSSPVLNGTVSGTAVSTAATANLLMLRDANANALANNFIQGYTTTATAAGTTTLTVSSTYLQFFTGSTTQTVVMPDVTTLALGMQWLIVNNSSGAVTVQSSGANSIQVMAANSRLLITCISLTGTGTASWSAVYLPILTNVENTALSTWAGSSNITTLGTIGTGTWQGSVISSTYGGTGVNNSGRTLTISTNSGTLNFTASSKTLSINENLTLTGATGKTLTLTNSLTVSGNDGTLSFGAASKTLSVNNTLTFAGTDSTTITFQGTDTYVGRQTTDTLTNKTFDAEGTGNSLTVPIKVWLPAAGINNTTVGSMWDLPTSNPAVPTANTGTNVQKATLDFNSTAVAQNTLYLPSDFTGNIDVNIIWFTSATSGNCKWLVATSFTNTNGTATDDPSWNTASTITPAADTTTNEIVTSSITNVTATNSGASKLMHIKLYRDGSEASPITTARLIGLELTFRRAM